MFRRFLCVAMLIGALPLLAQEQPECVIVVGLHWPDHNLSHAQVRIFRDKERRDLVAAFPSQDASGKVVMAVAAGTYYLTAVVDLDNDGKLSTGDGLGFHGVEDPATQQPQPLEVKVKLSALLMPISLVMQADGKLGPTGVKVPALEAPPPIKWCRVSGSVSGGSGKLQVVYLVPKDCSPSSAVLPGAEGAFSLSVPAWEYYIFAVEDASDNEGVGPGDLFAVYGYRPEMGRDFPTVKVEQDVAEVQLKLKWRVGDTGLLKSLDDAVEGPQVDLGTLPAVLIGAIANVPEGSGAVVSACTDPRFIGQTETASTANSRFTLALGAGVYYLSAVSIKRPDLRTPPLSIGDRSAGDLVGFYGVSDLRKAHGPQPVALRPGEMRSVELHFIARLDEQLRPVPLD